MSNQSIVLDIRALARLSTPIIISLAASMLIGVVDTIMIAPLGTVALAAASITVSIQVVFFACLYGFVSGTSVRMSETFGAGDVRGLSEATLTGLVIGGGAGALGMGLMLALRPGLAWLGQPPEVLDALSGGYWQAMAVLLVPFTLFYMLKGLFDAVGAPWLGVSVAFGAVAINVPANWLLIYGIGGWGGLGLSGAAYASLLSQSASLGVAWALWRFGPAFASARRVVALTRSEVLRQLRAGGMIATGYFSEGAVYACVGLMVGWFGAGALAANQIVNSVATVLYMVPLGISIAVSIVVGQALGAGQDHRIRGIGVAALSLSVGWMVTVMLGLLILAGPIAGALSTDPAVVALATTLFWIIAATQIADGIQGTMLGAARGMTDNSVPVAATLLGNWGVALPLAYALGVFLGWGPEGIWIGYGLGLAFAALLVSWRFFWKVKRLTPAPNAPT